MSPKFMTHKGKKYFVDDNGDAEPVADAPAADPVADPAADPAVNDQIDTAAKKIADDIVAALPLDKLSKAIEALNDHKNLITPTAKDIMGGELTKDVISKMTTRQKIVKFFQAAIQADHSSLKALSEGTAGAGGYLFPKFIGELKLG